MNKINKKTEGEISHLHQHLTRQNVEYTILSHENHIFSAEDGERNGMGSLKEMAPTFLLKTENGYLFAIISGVSKLSYKKIKKKLGLKNISLAKPEEVLEQTGEQVGTVSLINQKYPVILSDKLLEVEHVFGGCGVPNHTLKIEVNALISLLKPEVFDFTELKTRN